MCLQTDKGQVVAPTGSGKTVIALDCIKSMARHYNEEKCSFIVVVFVHRILLAFVNINSGGLSSIVKNDIEKSIYNLRGPGVIPVLSSTNPRDIRERINGLVNRGFSVMVPCTYHSAGVLINSNIPVSLAIHDECQVLPNNPEHRRCLDLTADKKLFFTATPCLTASDEGWGQNNERVYGPVVFEMKPVEAIKIGAIVGPEIHIVGTEWESGQINDGELRKRDFNTLSELIFEAHAKHKIAVAKQSYDPTKIGAKLLVVCNGQLELEGVFASKSFKQLKAENQNVKVFGLSSDFGIFLNGEHTRPPITTLTKEEFLFSLYEMGVEEDAIILHVDMISEGLDVPSITGMMPLRNFSSTMKFLQNVGRATRVHPGDMERIESGELKPCDWDNYIKPCCHIILPSCVRDHHDFVTRYALILDDLRRHYDFDPSQVINVDILSSAQAGPEFEGLEREIRGNIRDDINNFYYTREQDNLDLQEALMVHRLIRYVTDEEPTTLIEMLGNLS